MTKTIDEQLKDIEEQEKALAKKRQQLETQKQQKDAKQETIAHYVKKFKDLGFNFIYSEENVTISPLDYEHDICFDPIVFDTATILTTTLDTLLQQLRLKRDIEAYKQASYCGFGDYSNYC